MIRLLIFSACVGFTQVATAQSPTFDVASIKPSKLVGEGSRRESTQSSPGSLMMRNVSFRTAVMWAYNVQSYQVTGPQWIGDERYDIVAKTANPAPDSQMRQMLQALLADRFKLTLHRQQKELQALVATVGKGGSKLKPAEVADGPYTIASAKGATASIKSISMEEAAGLLSAPLQMPVVDMTGLKGRFDVTIDLTPYIADVRKEGPEDAGVIIDILNKVAQDQLGLKLETRKTPVEILTIDSAEKVPTEN
jgi:uncharacterized protein (TIGR03435 family)